MGWNQRGGASGRMVTKQETKICPLCGALNYQRNMDCLTCGWHGRFERDLAAIDYRWQCLVERHEEVRLEHLVVKGSRVIGDFGEVRRPRLWQRMRSACTRRWQAFQSRRTERHDIPLRPKTSSSPQ